MIHILKVNCTGNPKTINNTVRHSLYTKGYIFLPKSSDTKNVKKEFFYGKPNHITIDSHIVE